MNNQDPPAPNHPDEEDSSSLPNAEPNPSAALEHTPVATTPPKADELAFLAQPSEDPTKPEVASAESLVLSELGWSEFDLSDFEWADPGAVQDDDLGTAEEVEVSKAEAIASGGEGTASEEEAITTGEEAIAVSEGAVTPREEAATPGEEPIAPGEKAVTASEEVVAPEEEAIVYGEGVVSVGEASASEEEAVVSTEGDIVSGEEGFVPEEEGVAAGVPEEGAVVNEQPGGPPPLGLDGGPPPLGVEQAPPSRPPPPVTPAQPEPPPRRFEAPTWSWGFPRWDWGTYAVPYALLAVVQVVTAVIFLMDRSPGTDAALTGFPLDDSWIHLVYARALAAGEGFAYNPGQPETGATSPLWALLLAPLFWLKPLWGGSIVAGVKGLGLLIAWAVSAVAWRLGHRLTGYAAVGYAAGLLIALDPFMTFAKLSGMEVMLFAGLGMYLVWSLAERRLGGIVVGLALLPLARPEGVVIWGLGAGCTALLLWVHVRRWWAWPVVFLPTVLSVGSWVAYCYTITGKPLPATYYAKHSRRKELWDQANMDVLGQMLADLPPLYMGIGLGLAALGALFLLWPPASDRRRSIDQWALRASIVLYPPLFVYAISRVHVFQQHWPFYWNRYFQPVIPALYVVIAVGFGVLLMAAWKLGRQRKVLSVVAVVAVMCVWVAPGRSLFLETKRLKKLYAGNCENINEMNVEVGKWLKEHVPEDEWIALNDAGAIRFFSERNAVDLIGLNNHRLLFGGRKKVLDEHNPTHFAIFPSWFEHTYAKSKRYESVFSVQAKNYTICSCDQANKAIYRERSPEEIRKLLKEEQRERRRKHRERVREARQKRIQERRKRRQERRKKSRNAPGGAPQKGDKGDTVNRKKQPDNDAKTTPGDVRPGSKKSSMPRLDPAGLPRTPKPDVFTQPR